MSNMMQVLKSKVSGICSELEFFWEKFISSFGKVIEVQILIATINGVLSTIGLWIIGFPHLLGFGMMVMLIGLIPVAGVLGLIVGIPIFMFILDIIEVPYNNK